MSDDERGGIEPARIMHAEMVERLEQIDDMPEGADFSSAIEMTLQSTIAEALIGIKAELEELNRTITHAYRIWYRDVRTR
jgi:hypothetical protein